MGVDYFVCIICNTAFSENDRGTCKKKLNEDNEGCSTDFCCDCICPCSNINYIDKKPIFTITKSDVKNLLEIWNKQMMLIMK